MKQSVKAAKLKSCKILFYKPIYEDDKEEN
jgi:hypothetical protein